MSGLAFKKSANKKENIHIVVLISRPFAQWSLMNMGSFVRPDGKEGRSEQKKEENVTSFFLES